MKKRKISISQRIVLILKTSTGLKVASVFCAVILLSSLVVFLIERKTNTGFISFFDSLWWTIVTISTVGYGDRLPLSISGRIVALAVIFCGMGIMGTVTGRIASFLMERQMKEEKGLLDYKNLKGHFVVCGWKREMNRILCEILNCNPNFSPLEVVMINRASQEDMNAVRNDPNLKGIKYVHGDFMEEHDLVRAGVHGASRVLILADYLTEGDLQQIDSKTVMAVMTIKNINKHAYVCAELLDTKFEKYLKLSHCDEILLSRDFIRSMIASSAAGTGLSHVVFALLHKNKDVGITTLPLPEVFINKTYKDLVEHFLSEKNILLLGLLENTGNIMARKQEALREAQKNPDISKLVPDLKSIKNLYANYPIINPPMDYLIKKYTRAIVIIGSTYSNSGRSV